MSERGHAIVWTFDHDSVCAKAVCNEPDGADCRLTGGPGCECESWHIERDLDGTPFHMVEEWLTQVRHENRPVDYCNVVEFLNEGGYIEELNAKGEHFELARVPVELTWTGDGYEWSRAVIRP